MSNISFKNMIISSNYSIINAENKNTSNLTYISVSNLQIINATLFLISLANYEILAFFMFDRPLMRYKIENCYFKNIIGIYNNKYHDQPGLISILQSKDFIYIKSIIIEEFFGKCKLFSEKLINTVFF